MFFDKPKLSEPNEMGFQFGINKSLTEYAHKEVVQDAHSSLPAVDITVLEVWKNDQRVSYLLVKDGTNEPVDDQQGYEAAAVAIDKFRLLVQAEACESVDNEGYEEDC